MRAMRQGWSLRKVRRTWAQGKMGKGMAVLLGVAMVMPSLAAVPPWSVAARARGG